MSSQITRTIPESIEALISATIDKYPYLARSFLTLTPVEVPGFPTFGVDRKWRLYWSHEAMAEYATEQGLQLAELMMHELQHCLRGDVDIDVAKDQKMKVNIAMDLAIDDDISKDFENSSFVPVEKILNRSLPRGLTWGEYYNLIVQNMPPPPSNGGGGEGTEGELQDPGDLLDTEAGDAKNAPGVQPHEVDTVRERAAAEIRDYARKNPGSVPNHMLVWADQKLKKTPVDWRKIFVRTIQASLVKVQGRADYDYTRLSRRSRSTDRLILPGTCAFKPTVDVVIDTSGSMSSFGPVVGGVVDSLLQTGAQVFSIYCDCEATERKPVQSAQKVIAQAEGGGGTDLSKGLAVVKSSIAVIITDGDTPWGDRPKGVTTTVILTDGDRSVPNWVSNKIIVNT